MTRLEEMLAESGLADPEQAEVSELLAPLATPDVAPEPSPELAALLGEPTGGLDPGVPDPRALRRWRVRTATVGAVVLAVSGVGATGLSAAANTLPSAVQHHVSQFSRHYLPFEFPEPSEKVDQPLSQGRFALAPETTAPHGPDTSAATGDVLVPLQAVAGPGRPSQADPFLSTPRPAVPDQQDSQTSGYHSYGTPSASPSPSASATPSPSASPSPDKPGGKPASMAPSPSPTPGPSPDKGQGGAGKPGKSHGSSSPVTSPGKTPGMTPGMGAGSGTSSSAGSNLGSLPGVGQGHDTPGTSEDTPTAPDPGGVLPALPDTGVLPEVPFAP